MLKIQSLSIQYPPHTILENISFSVTQGHTLAIVGKSGCGKSSLLSAIAGILPKSFSHRTVNNRNNKNITHNHNSPTVIIHGNIYWQGKNIEHHRGHAHFMQQDDLLLPWLNIIENIALPLRIKGVKKKEAHIQAEKNLLHFDLQASANFYPAQLSGGMRQRIALLRTCIWASVQLNNKKPKLSLTSSTGHTTNTSEYYSPLLLLDEPFARLDTITKQQCQIWARTILDELQATVILVTHDIEESIKFADSIILLKSKSTGDPAYITHRETITRPPISTPSLSSSNIKSYDQKLLKKQSVEYLHYITKTKQQMIEYLQN